MASDRDSPEGWDQRPVVQVQWPDRHDGWQLASPMSSRTPGYWQTTPGLYACEPSHWQPLPAPPAPDFRRAASALRGER